MTTPFKSESTKLTIPTEIHEYVHHKYSLGSEVIVDLTTKDHPAILIKSKMKLLVLGCSSNGELPTYTLGTAPILEPKQFSMNCIETFSFVYLNTIYFKDVSETSIVKSTGKHVSVYHSLSDALSMDN